MSDLQFTGWTLLSHRTQSFLQSPLRVLVGQCATLSQHAADVLEPPFFSDQRDDPRLSADTASQRLQTQPPELSRLVPALFPAGADLQRTGAGARVQGAAEEAESSGEKPSLACFAWA